MRLGELFLVGQEEAAMALMAYFRTFRRQLRRWGIRRIWQQFPGRLQNSRLFLIN